MPGACSHVSAFFSPEEEADSHVIRIVGYDHSPLYHLQEGNLALRNKDYQKAEKYLRRAVNMDSRLSTAWTLLLQALKAQDATREELEAVISEMREALSPEQLPLAEGRARQILGDAAAAEFAYFKALMLEPESLEVLYTVSSFYLQTTTPELAETFLKKMEVIIEADIEKGDNPQAPEQLAWVQDTLTQLAAMKEAEEQKAAESPGDAPEAEATG